MISTFAGRMLLCALLFGVVVKSARAASGPTTPTIQFCGLGPAHLNPKGNLCLRIKGGQLFWHSKLIREPNLLDYLRSALQQTKVTTIALFPSSTEKFGDVFRIASALGALPVDRIYITPPTSDDEFDQKTKDSP